jgi:hypothetical protein
LNLWKNYFKKKTILVGQSTLEVLLKKNVDMSNTETKPENKKKEKELKSGAPRLSNDIIKATGLINVFNFFF